MMQRFIVAVAIVSLIGCSRSSVELADMPIVDCFGVRVALPCNGRGTSIVTPDSFTWPKDSLVLTFHLLENNSILIKRNGEALSTALIGQSVKFRDDGQIESLK